MERQNEGDPANERGGRGAGPGAGLGGARRGAKRGPVRFGSVRLRSAPLGHGEAGGAPRRAPRGRFLLREPGGQVRAVLLQPALLEAAMACLAVDPAILLIVVGVLTFLITFCGCVGSLRENICLLQVFSVCLTIIFLLQLAAGALGFVFSDKAREKVSELINGAIVHYRDDLDLQNLIDFGQKEFSCCGGVSYKDWSQNMYFNCTATNPSRERCSVPFSCCLHEADQVCAGVALGTLPMPVLPAPGAGLGLERCPRAGNTYGPHP
uniref:Tetraspanin-33 n=1 Tax=Junco hyemalis TaxID=40217 RepID=A0A8C5NTC9_JUNHY